MSSGQLVVLVLVGGYLGCGGAGGLKAGNGRTGGAGGLTSGGASGGGAGGTGNAAAGGTGAGGAGNGGTIGFGGRGAGGVPGTSDTGGAGGVPGTGGLIGSGGGPGADGALGRGGATGMDGPVRDSSGDPATELDTGTRDVAIEAIGSDGAVAIDLGTALTCTAAGGRCSPNRWQICPRYYEPTAQETGHLDCRSNGWCCVPAPSSPCSDQGLGNCVPGDTCSGCWAPAPNTPACETGRVCCVDNCW